MIRENAIEDPTKIWAGTRLRIPLPTDRTRTPLARAETRAAGSETASIAELIDRCEAELRAARFEQALATAAETRDRIDARNRADDDSSRVRLEIASATAYVALADNESALAALERALVADPNLELDPALTSPKLLAVFRVARSRSQPTH